MHRGVTFQEGLGVISSCSRVLPGGAHRSGEGPCCPTRWSCTLCCRPLCRHGMPVPWSMWSALHLSPWHPALVITTLMSCPASSLAGLESHLHHSHHWSSHGPCEQSTCVSTPVHMCVVGIQIWISKMAGAGFVSVAN